MKSLKASLQTLQHLYRSVPVYPGDKLTALAIIALIIYLFAHFWFTPGYSGVEFVSIQVDKQAPKLYPITKNQELSIDGPLGPSKIEIKNGKVHFFHSPCLNKLCISHGWISRPGETVACLPNRISISLIGRESRFDALNF